MSVINQMLSQLEQRGANTTPTEQTMVRAVPQTRRNYVVPSLVFVALILGVTAWLWMQARKPAAVTEVAVVVAPPTEVLFTDSPALQLSVELMSSPLPSTLRKARDISGADKVDTQATNVSGLAHPVKSTLALTTSPDIQASHPSSNALPMKQVSPVQQADAEFRKAVALMQQGRIADALTGYEAALRLDAGHDAARQALAALLLEGKRGADAENVLHEGLKNKPEHTGFAMSLARLQVERGALDQAMSTLERSLPFAATQADYHAFYAALLQRKDRNEDAIAHYQIALQIAPTNGAWLMGYGISLQEAKRNADAKDAFKRALDTRTLSPELQAFVQQKLKGL